MDQDQLRHMLAALVAEHKALDPAYSYSRFGADLARMIGRKEPYKKQYIANVLKGVKGYPVSGELADGLQRLGAVQDGMDEFQAGLRQLPAGVQSMTPLHPNSVIMGASRLCAKPGCGLWFVPNSPSRRYCPRCRPPRHT